MEQQSIDHIFWDAARIADTAERDAFLQSACGEDAELRRRVEQLLAAQPQADQIFETPLPTEVAGLLDPTESEETAATLDFLTSSERPDALGRLAHFEVLEVVGHGGMGVVLRAFDEGLHRIVAIKVMAAQLAANAAARKRFAREAHAAAAVTHDNIVTIHAVDETDGMPYLVMQYVSGLSLQQRLDQDGPLELVDVVRIGMQTAMGLAAAHAQGLIHRDIKPANILLENGVERVKITDFGLARAADDAGITRTGEVTGTPHYMSPEQAQGGHVDARSDLFSLGSVLYAMCTGRSPFRAKTVMAALRRVCDDNPRPIREINSEVPDWLTAIIDRLLQKDPDDRFQTAGEVAELLGRHLAHLQHPSVASLPTPAHLENPDSTLSFVRQLRRPAKRSLVITAAVVVLLLGGLSLTEATGVTHLSSTVVRIVTGEGTLVVEVDDPSVQISLDGEELSITGAGLREVTLRPGQYQFEAVKDGTPVKRELVTITRGGRRVVAVTVEPPPSVQRANPLSGQSSTTDLFASNEWVWTEPVNLGPPVNTEHEEESPFLAPSGLTLIFCSNRPGGRGGRDLWQSTRASLDDSWGTPVNLGAAVNTANNECNSFLTADGLTLYLDSGRPGGQGNWDIWMHRRKTIDGEWSEPINLGPPVNGPTSDGAPFLTPDGLVLLFHSDRPGGEGGNDLWMSHRSSPRDEWSEPMPLGASVNTEHDERGPCLSPDGRTLFFCSNRNDVDLDLWMSRGASAYGPWSAPVKLGSRLNGGGQASYPTASKVGRLLVFESGRTGNVGAHDLWMSSRIPGVDHVGQANEYVARGRLDDAAAEFDKALGLIGEQDWVERREIVELIASPDELFQRVVELRPLDSNLWNNRAYYWAEKGRWDEAIADYQKRLVLGSADAGMWKVYAYALLAKNDDVAYRRLCESMLATFEKDSNAMAAAHTAMSMVFVPHSVKDEQRVFEMSKRGMDGLPGEPWAIQTHAAWLYRLDRLEESIECMQEAPQIPREEFLCFLAMAHHRLGHAAKARRLAVQVKATRSSWGENGVWYRRVRLDRLIAEMDTVLAVAPVEREDWAFVLLRDDAAESRRFATLEDAVFAARDGDTIEIRGNGPFETDPVTIGRPLTIRAGEGFRPVLRQSEDSEQTSNLITVNKPLVLEGLVIEKLGRPSATDDWTYIVMQSRSGSLHAANCRFVKSTAGACIWVGGVHVLRNCEFATSHLALHYWSPMSNSTYVVENCCLIGTIIFVGQPDLTAATLVLRRNTIVGTECLYVAMLESPERATPDALDRPIHLQATGNVFHAEDGWPVVHANHGGLKTISDTSRPQEPPDVGALARGMIDWRGECNFFSSESPMFLATVRFDRDHAVSAADLAAWRGFWGPADSESLQGPLRFRGGDIFERRKASPDLITAEDLRLEEDSTTFGADVDIVGPGAAYERWKQTPEYQEWLKRVAELMQPAQNDPSGANEPVVAPNPPTTDRRPTTDKRNGR